MERLEGLERQRAGNAGETDSPPCAGGWRLRLLGTWDLARDGQRFDTPRSVQRLITVLALLKARPRSFLSGLLWPDSSEEQAAGNLRNCIWRTSHDFPQLLSAAKDPLMLSPEVRVDVDMLTRIYDPAGDFPRPPYATEAIELLREAELLPGWYTDWVLHSQERIRQLRIAALEKMSELSLAEGFVTAAVDAAQAAVSVDPLRESAHKLLIQGHIAAGNRATAHRVYGKLHSRLHEELGIAPSPELTRLIWGPQPPSGSRLAT
jgi:SARP family transcriptional regulator, regulator of embCAB operon